MRLISATWLKSYENDPPSLHPTDHGFELTEGKYFPKWFEGDVAPPTVDSISLREDLDEEEYEDSSGDEDEDSGDEEVEDGHSEDENDD